MLDEGDKAIMQRAFAAELYPALAKTEEKLAKEIPKAITQHHDACNYREAIPKFELQLIQIKSEAEKATIKAEHATEKADDVKKSFDARVNQVWGGWRVLLAIGGILGFILAALEFLIAVGVIPRHK